MKVHHPPLHLTTPPASLTIPRSQRSPYRRAGHQPSKHLDHQVDCLPRYFKNKTQVLALALHTSSVPLRPCRPRGQLRCFEIAVRAVTVMHRHPRPLMTLLPCGPRSNAQKSGVDHDLGDGQGLGEEPSQSDGEVTVWVGLTQLGGIASPRPEHVDDILSVHQTPFLRLLASSNEEHGTSLRIRRVVGVPGSNEAIGVDGSPA
jgi:hypothetical protein